MTKQEVTKEETLVEHLTELRKRLISSILFLFVAFLISFFQAPKIYAFLTSQFHQKLLVLGPDDILWIYMTLAGMAALSLSLPFLTYQIWAYIRPALDDKEARALLAYIPTVFLCFLAGLGFGFFFVTPSLLAVLLSLGEGLFETQITAQNYIAFVIHTSIPLAILFEFPVLVAFLTSLGLLSPKWLCTYRRQAYFALIVLAVMLTPADLVSDLALSLPLIFIYECSILISRVIQRRKEKKDGIS